MQNENLKVLRKLFSKHDISGYFIPRTDPHQSEYIARYWESVSWLTGFTGSAANVVITADFAGVWTDSRYFIQGERQLKNSSFELMKLRVPHTPQYIEWLVENFQEGQTLGVDGKLISRAGFKYLEKRLRKKNIHINTKVDLINPSWNSRAPFPNKMIFDHPVQYCGKSRAEKLIAVRQEMKTQGADGHIIAALDDIAWLLNIRGLDSDFTPFAISYLYLNQTKVYLFIQVEKVPESVKELLRKDGVELLPYQDLDKFLYTLSEKTTLLLDPKRTSQWIHESVPEHCKILEQENITTVLKSIKNKVEIENIKKVMLKDGIALTKFLIWLENNLGKQRITEISAAEQLEAFRREQGDFISPSFSTIAGYKEHGAIVHYRATPETVFELKPEGLFLLDSGAQYLDGTTDITRTIALGPPTNQEKKDFTLVLKGHIQIARQRFPSGTKGYQLDILARQAMWQHGINFGHGTGHGVGFCLNVHEGPQSISSSGKGGPNSAFVPGMLTSNEPGIYREGEYGIRTENLVLTVFDEETPFGEFYGFETVTLCPIDRSLIDASLMTPEEISWLNAYHKNVYNLVSPHLDAEENLWLMEKTKTI